MRLPVSLLTLAAVVVQWVASSPASAKIAGKKTKNEEILNYFNKLLPVAEHNLLHELGGPEIGAAVNPHPLLSLKDIFLIIIFCFRQPGVVLTLLPDPAFPDWALFWYRDAALVWHLWLNRLISTGDDSYRSHVDDAVHAIIKSQHTSNLAGNVLTGGLAEGVYDRHIQRVLGAEARVGSPGGGERTTISIGLF